MTFALAEFNLAVLSYMYIRQSTKLHSLPIFRAIRYFSLSLFDFLKDVDHVLHGRSGGEGRTGLNIHRLCSIAREVVQHLTVCVCVDIYVCICVCVCVYVCVQVCI